MSSVTVKRTRKNVIEMLDLFNSKYKCRKCSTKLRYKTDQLIHENYKHSKSSTTANTATLKCIYCENSFKNYYQLRKHIQIKHLNERPYTCKLCKLSYSQFIHLKIHIRKMHDCESLFKLIEYDNSKLKLIDNCKVKVSRKVVSSNEDNKNEILNEFMVINEDENDENEMDNCHTINCNLNCFKCFTCSKLCLTQANYLTHVWKHKLDNLTGLIMCWLCNNCYFKTYNDLEEHLLVIHTHEMPFKCSICEYCTSTIDQIDLHMNEIHNNKSKNSYLDDIMDLATHMDIDLDNNDDENSSLLLKKRDNNENSQFIVNYSCVLCANKRQFRTYNDILTHYLNIHLPNNSKTHANTKCTHCNETYSNKQMLILHQKQHEFYDSLVATSSAIITAASRTLTSSTNNNTPTPTPSTNAIGIIPANVAKFKSKLLLNCDLCGFKFDNNYSLCEHRKLHINDNNLKRPFKCHLCQVTFSKIDQLTRHMIIHQCSELDFVCEICYSTFSRKQDLDRHMNFHSK